MDLKLADKIALVTGGGGQVGYGKNIAITLAKEGCHTIIADLDLQGAQKTAEEVENIGRKTLAVKTDVRDRAEVDAMVNTAIDRFGRIDILVNNAGASTREKPLWK